MRKHRSYFGVYFVGSSYEISSNVAHMKQPEYTEGTQALENFKSLATAILQAPAKKKKRQTKKSASRKKPKKSDKG
jgi:hypothetical protein